MRPEQLELLRGSRRVRHELRRLRRVRCRGEAADPSKRVEIGPGRNSTTVRHPSRDRRGRGARGRPAPSSVTRCTGQVADQFALESRVGGELDGHSRGAGPPAGSAAAGLPTSTGAGMGRPGARSGAAPGSPLDHPSATAADEHHRRLVRHPAIGHHDDHGDGLVGRNQIVEDAVRDAELGPVSLVAANPVQQVQDRDISGRAE